MAGNGYILNFGKYGPDGDKPGTPITRVPVNYLRWMVNTFSQTNKRMDKWWAGRAAEELQRRGTVLPILEISGHAIDRASQRLLNRWLEERSKNNDEGLYSWLARKAEVAIKLNNSGDKKYITYDKIKFVFEFENKEWPVLKTVMFYENKNNREQNKSKIEGKAGS